MGSQRPLYTQDRGRRARNHTRRTFGPPLVFRKIKEGYNQWMKMTSDSWNRQGNGFFSECLKREGVWVIHEYKPGKYFRHRPWLTIDIFGSKGTPWLPPIWTRYPLDLFDGIVERLWLWRWGLFFFFHERHVQTGVSSPVHTMSHWRKGDLVQEGIWTPHHKIHDRVHHFLCLLP